MTKLILNKGTSRYAILSLGIAMFLLMFFFTTIFLNFNQNNKKGKGIILFELKNGHPSNIKDLLYDEISMLLSINKSKATYISKEDGLATFKKSLDSKVFDELVNNNPLNAIVKFETDEISDEAKVKLLSLSQKLDNFVTQIKVNSSNQSIDVSFDKLSKAFIPFILICLFFCLNILLGSIRGDLILNKTDIKKAFISGVDSKVLINDLRANMLRNFLIASLIALILYFSTFYLITSHLDVNFSNFGYYIFLKPIFTSLLIVLISILIIINFKVKKFLKTI